MATDNPARRRRLLIFGCVLIGVMLVTGYAWLLSRPAPVPATVVEHPVSMPRPVKADDWVEPDIHFTDITESAGIDFVHQTGHVSARLLPETMGGGAAFLDFNNDGHEDILLINSGRWPWLSKTTTDTRSRLYKGRGDGTFVDASALLQVDVYGMGVAVADFDGDGYVDVFVTALGSNRLYKNLSGEGFADVTDAAGVAGHAAAWSTAAAFFDYDRDGDLDLFVANYVAWSEDKNAAVDYRIPGIGPAFGPPNDFPGSASWLYRNEGDTFSDQTESSGISVSHEQSGQFIAKALAVHPLDVNGDGWLDLVVANDTVRNFLFLNTTDGGFREVGMQRGIAFDRDGLATGAMGLDSLWLPDEAKLIVAIGNYAGEMTSFFASAGATARFTDDAIGYGIGAGSRRALTFGLMFVDLNLDGYADLVAVNGHVEPEINKVQTSQHYAQPPQIFWNCGPDCRPRYRVAAKPSGDFQAPLVGRGGSYADIDHDGDLDLLMTQIGRRPVLLRNDQQSGNHWMQIDLRSTTTNRHALGADILVTTSRLQRRTIMPSRSYLSQVQLVSTFGLGLHSVAERVAVRWPNGTIDRWHALGADQRHVLRQGSGDETCDLAQSATCQFGNSPFSP